MKTKAQQWKDYDRIPIHHDTMEKLRGIKLQGETWDLVIRKLIEKSSEEGKK